MLGENFLRFLALYCMCIMSGALYVFTLILVKPLDIIPFKKVVMKW
jgi:hypothetical protein